MEYMFFSVNNKSYNELIKSVDVEQDTSTFASETNLPAPSLETVTDSTESINGTEEIDLLQAIRLGHLTRVREHLTGEALETLNTPDSEGLTPLHIAVQTGNVLLVEELLKFGAAESVNVADAEHVTPLGSAVGDRNDDLVLLLLEHGATKSIDIEDGKGLTPFQRSIINGRATQVRAMLESYPEAAKALNRPDKFGVTNLQRAARSGNMELMSLLLAKSIDQEILTNDEAYFTSSELKACTTQNEIEVLKSMPIEAFAFPLTIAQNFCHVMVRLADGKVLTLRNADAVEVRDHLMTSKFGSGWVSDQGSNVLVAYLSPGHGFLRLECRNCDDGKPYSMNRGFYPRGMKLTAVTQRATAKSDNDMSFKEDDMPAKSLQVVLLELFTSIELSATIELQLESLSQLTLLLAILSDQGPDYMLNFEQPSAPISLALIKRLLKRVQSLKKEGETLAWDEVIAILETFPEYADLIKHGSLKLVNSTNKALKLIYDLSSQPSTIREVLKFLHENTANTTLDLFNDCKSVIDTISDVANGLESPALLAKYFANKARSLAAKTPQVILKEICESIGLRSTLEQQLERLSQLTLIVAILYDQGLQSMPKLKTSLGPISKAISKKLLMHIISLKNQNRPFDWEEVLELIKAMPELRVLVKDGGLQLGDATKKALKLLYDSTPQVSNIDDILKFLSEHTVNTAIDFFGDTNIIIEALSRAKDGLESADLVAKYFGKKAKSIALFGKSTVSLVNMVAKTAITSTIRYSPISVPSVSINIPGPSDILNSMPSPSSIKKMLGSYAREGMYMYQDYIVNNFMMMREQVGNIGNEDWYENDSDTRNSLKLMFYVTDDQAKKALEAIKNVENSCEDNPHQACHYFLTSQNCVDFVSSVFINAGGVGAIMDYVTDEQVGFGHLHTPSRIFEFKALEYSYLQARGWPHYLKAGAYITMNSLVNKLPIIENDLILNRYSLPHHFVNANELEVPVSVSEANLPQTVSISALSIVEEHSGASEAVMDLHIPSIATGVFDNLALAVTLNHIAGKCISGIKNLWLWNVGEKVSSISKNDFCFDAIDTVKEQEALLNDVDRRLDQIRTAVYGEIAALENYPQKAFMRSQLDSLRRCVNQLQSEQLDLVFKGIELRKSYKKLIRSRTQPSQRFLDQCKSNLVQFVTHCRRFHRNFKRKFFPNEMVRIVA